jgi:hypothetical protein
VRCRSSHEKREHSEGLCTEATIDGLILLGGNYLVAIVSMICLCRSGVNGLNKVPDCDCLDVLHAMDTAKIDYFLNNDIIVDSGPYRGPWLSVFIGRSSEF